MKSFTKIFLGFCVNVIFGVSRVASGEIINDVEVPSLFPIGMDYLDVGTNQNTTFWEFVNNGTGILSKIKSEIELKCEASYPITWNITGHIHPSEIIKIQPYKRTLIKSDESNNSLHFYTLKMLIFFLDAEEISESSSRIYCQSFADHRIQSSIDVFVPGTMPFVNSGEVITVRNGDMIPCPTTDPSFPVKLFKTDSNVFCMFSVVNGKYPVFHVHNDNNIFKGNKEEISETDVPYDPVVGFHLENTIFEEELYECTTSNENETDTVSVKFEMHAVRTGDISLEYSPYTKIIKAFKDDWIPLRCYSVNTTQIKMEIFDENDVIIDSTSNTSEISYKLLFNGSTSGFVNCSATFEGNSSEMAVWTWNYQFIDPPQLYLDNFEGEVDCLSDQEEKSVSTVRCINPSHCEYMKRCFENPTFCNFKKQKHFFANTSTRCWIQPQNAGELCASVPYSHLNGIIECNIGGLKRNWEFFVALDFRRYSNWKEAAQKDLVKLDPVDSVLYSNNTTTFFCTSVSYLFADSLKFSIEFENGTVVFVNESQYQNPGIENPRKIDEFNILGELKINLPKEAVAIRCHAPWWNSSEFLTTETRFQVKDLIEPKITPTDSEVNFTSKDRNTRIKCEAEGEPKPQYTWFHNSMRLEESDEVEIHTGSKGESILEFLSLSESTTGTYTCEVSNYIGSSSFNFTVTYTE